MKKRKFTEQEHKEFILKAVRSVDYPWNLTLEGWYHAVKAEKRAEASRREAQKVNENRREKTNWRKQTARAIIEHLIKTDSSLRLPGKQTKLAECVQARWPKHDKAPAIHTLRHWLAEMRPKK
jgi:hypothetical protein